MKRELLDNGNIWQKSDGRWIGLVRYKDEFGVAQRKSFSSKKKKTLQAKMTEYVKNFNEQVANSDESKKPLKESMKNWLRVYKYPEVERTTYDRYECTAEHQIYPYIGNKPVGDVTPADIKKLLTKHMNAGYAFTTSKKAYSLLKMFFKQLYQEGAIPNNPMALIDMTKKDNYLAAQNKESKPQCDMVVVFTDEELDQIKAEAFKRFANGKPPVFLVTCTLIVDESEKVPAQLDEAPTALDLTYTGEPQTLIEAGKASGGTMMYALGTDDANAPSSVYSAELPAGTDAGDYYVWYYVKGDALHTDTSPQCLTANIKRKIFTGHSLTLEGDIGVNFYVDLTAEEAANATVSFTWMKNGAEKTATVNGSGTVTYSPMTYCYEAQTSSNVKLVNVVKALYNYWFAAEIFFS